jgi:hypothetical protein
MIIQKWNTEYLRLKDAPYPIKICPKCQSAFSPFLRGLIKSYWRGWFRMKSSCLICYACKEIVGYE